MVNFRAGYGETGVDTDTYKVDPQFLLPVASVIKDFNH